MGRRYNDEYNAIRRINSAIERAYNKYGRFTKEYSAVVKAIKENFKEMANITDPYITSSNGPIRIKDTVAIRQGISGTDILENIEKFKPSLRVMKSKYKDVFDAQYTYLSESAIQSIYDYIDENPLLSQEQKDQANVLFHGYGSDWNKDEGSIDKFIDVVKAAMTDRDLDIEKALVQLKLINYEDTPPEGTGYNYSSRLGL